MPAQKGGTHHDCKGARLDDCHDTLACHAQGEKRNDIIRTLNCWINTIENQERDLKKPKFKEPCREYVLCYPQFKCEEGLPESRKPLLCLKGDTLQPLIPAVECYKKKNVWKKDDLPMAAWERPRVRSSQLVAGEFRKVRECFRANGLNDFDYCPRTKSCQLMRCLNQMIEEDRKLMGPEGITSDCCCRPGDTPSRMPQFKCFGCGAPSKYGHKDLNCPPEIGRHGEHHQQHKHDDSCKHAHHQNTDHPEARSVYRVSKSYPPEMGRHGGFHQHDVACQLVGHQLADNYPYGHQTIFHGKNEVTTVPGKSVRPPKDRRAHHSPPHTVNSNQMAGCLARNNPRDSADLWKDDVDFLKEFKTNQHSKKTGPVKVLNANRIADCLSRNNPRDSAEMWKDDVALMQEINLV